MRRQKDAIKRLKTELDRVETEYDALDDARETGQRNLDGYKKVMDLCDEAHGLAERLWRPEHRTANLELLGLF